MSSEPSVIFSGDLVQSSYLYQTHEIVSASLVGGKIEVVRRYPSNVVLGNGERTPDRIVKEIYVAKGDGQIHLEKTIDGKHERARVIPEKFRFPE